MGGRHNVIDVPFTELLGYVIMDLEEAEAEVKKEQTDYYLNFIAMLNANPPQSKEQARKLDKFTEMIRPKKEVEKKAARSKPKWNKRVQEKIERQKLLQKQ